MSVKIMDCVELTVEKECYAKEGVHKRMQGWICDPRTIDRSWLVDFPQCGEKSDIAIVPVEEEDLVLIPVMHVIVNEQIKAKFDGEDQR